MLLKCSDGHSVYQGTDIFPMAEYLCSGMAVILCVLLPTMFDQYISFLYWSLFCLTLLMNMKCF